MKKQGTTAAPNAKKVEEKKEVQPVAAKPVEAAKKEAPKPAPATTTTTTTPVKAAAKKDEVMNVEASKESAAKAAK